MELEISSLQHNFISGDWLSNPSANRIQVNNPSTLEILGSVPDHGHEEADKAVTAAARCFEEWGAASPTLREEVLRRAADLMEANRDDIARIITLEQGKPIEESRGEIEYGVNFVRWYAAEARRMYGEIVPATDTAKHQLVFREPVGPVLLISAGNDPFAMITRKGAPALAAGCPLIVKPHRETPFTAMAVAAIFHEAGLPSGGINVLTTSASAEISEYLLSQREIRHLTFTGSSAVGLSLGSIAGGYMKGMTMELGGHAPFIVFDDANLELATDDLVSRKFTNAGQTCSCPARIFLHRSIATSFIEKFVEKATKVTVGDGFDPLVTMGPMQNQGALDKVEHHLEDALIKGAKLLCGGKRVNTLPGYFFAPTVIAGASDEMHIMQQETFGPVAALTEFTTEEELFGRMNHPEYGLTGYCYTGKMDRMFQVVDRLRCGFIGVNDRRPQGTEVPMGGIGLSGIGREGGHWGLEEFTHLKYVSIKSKV